VAVEEPESHLHPHAIHQLRKILQQMAARHQVVITTHNPLFVDRLHVSHNVLVDASRARPAKSIAEIRELLGVRVADNLWHAVVVVVVEGEDDAAVFRSWIASASSTLAAAINDGSLTFDTLGGGTNLGYKLAQLRTALCPYHVVMDHDAAGKLAVKRSQEEGVLDSTEFHQTVLLGRDESELEDWIDSSCYVDEIRSRFGVDLASAKFRGKRKWSERLRLTFESQGKPWDDIVKGRAKAIACESASRLGYRSVSEQAREALGSIVRALEDRLKALSSEGAAPPA